MRIRRDHCGSVHSPSISLSEKKKKKKKNNKKNLDNKKVVGVMALLGGIIRCEKSVCHSSFVDDSKSLIVLLTHPDAIRLQRWPVISLPGNICFVSISKS